MEALQTTLKVWILITLCLCFNNQCEGTRFRRPMPENVTVTEGDTAILKCAIINGQNHKVVWLDRFSTLLTYQSLRIIDNVRIDVENHYLGEWNLVIRDVTANDAGRYVCQINTQAVRTKQVNLIVKVPPDIKEYWSSPNQIIREGSTVRLTCNATGIPQPDISWYRKTVYSDTETKEVIGTPGEILLIHNITRYCDGIYECVASNGVGDDVSKEIHIDVQFPPEVHLLNKKISQEIGLQIILSCTISASPQAMGMWLKGGKAIEPRSRMRTDIYEDSPHTVTINLRIINIQPEDFGYYSCEASNELGGDSEGMIFYESKQETTTPIGQVTEEMTINRDSNNHYSNGHHIRPDGHEYSNNHYNFPDPEYRYTGGENKAGVFTRNIFLLALAVITIVGM